MDRECARCGQTFQTRRPEARFCSGRCRNSAQRARAKGQPERDPKAATPAGEPAETFKVAGTLAAVVAELTAAGVLESSTGQVAVALARRIDKGAESSAGLAALSRELRSAMSDAGRSSGAPMSLVDDLRKRREKRLSAS